MAILMVPEARLRLQIEGASGPRKIELALRAL